MRGKGILFSVLRVDAGITPAYAGKSSGKNCCGAVFWDHPRICGEKPDGGGWEQRDGGSPPHMRGKASSSGQRMTRLWITPAYAGKSTISCGLTSNLRDHPRICGEKLGLFTVQRDLIGSPPHMRGKVAHSPVRAEGVGITPAYAGKRSGWVQRPPRSRDHPRICGEKPLEEHGGAVITGSPPHMRGKVLIC